MEMQKRNYMNNELNVEMNCYIDKLNQIWFRGKELALILDYKNPRRAIRSFVHDDDKKLITLKIKPLASGTKTVPQAESREITRKCFSLMNPVFTLLS